MSSPVVPGLSLLPECLLDCVRLNVLSHTCLSGFSCRPGTLHELRTQTTITEGHPVTLPVTLRRKVSSSVPRSRSVTPLGILLDTSTPFRISEYFYFVLSRIPSLGLGVLPATRTRTPRFPLFWFQRPKYLRIRNSCSIFIKSGLGEERGLFTSLRLDRVPTRGWDRSLLRTESCPRGKNHGPHLLSIQAPLPRQTPRLTGMEPDVSTSTSTSLVFPR